MNLKLLEKTIPFKWRVQSFYPNKNNATKVILIPYVDARDVAILLDEVVGKENWQDEYKEVKGRLYCTIYILVGDKWIGKSDVGVESRTEKEKGEASDAFKRAAVKWGINRDAYQVGMIELPVKKHTDNNFYPVDESGKFIKKKDVNAHCNKIAKIEELENWDIDIKMSSQSQSEETEYNRIMEAIKTAPTLKFLQSIEDSGTCDTEQLELIKERRKELAAK